MRLAPYRTAMSHRLRFVVQTALISASLALIGCVGDLVELTGRDGGGGGGRDMAMAQGDLATGDGGGPVSFAASVNPDFTSLGCTIAGCHGGTQIPVLKDGAAEVMNNFMHAKTEATNGATSLLLTKPLAVAAGGVTHTGGNGFFASTQDAKYKVWLAWVTGGQAP